LTRLVRNLVEAHPAPSVRGRQIKVKVATRAGAHPPTVIVHGNQLESLPSSYQRYLENGFREALNLVGNPVKIQFRQSENPFAGRRNKLTPRQEYRRERVIRHRKERLKKGRSKKK
jgi:GTP-binding protein